ncbi:LysR substrate-binding domain-containing protein [Escherichia coli]
MESDLNIQLLDRSGHRAKFTRTGKMLLEKGREVLHTVRELEKQAIKLHEGWENELVIGVDDTFPFSLLAPLIEAFYQHHSVTRLKFINGVFRVVSQMPGLRGERILLLARCMSHHLPVSLVFHSSGDLEQVFAVAPHHPLALEEEPLNRRIIKRYRAIVVGDTAQAGASTASQLLDEQEAITVFDFKTKLELKLAASAAAIYPVIWRNVFSIVAR